MKLLRAKSVFPGSTSCLADMLDVWMKFYMVLAKSLGARYGLDAEVLDAGVLDPGM